MTALLTMSKCPNCGAPHSVAPDRLHIICVYCSTSLSVTRPAGATLAELKAEAISKEEIERIKELLIDGERDEAVAHYMRVASVPKVEADRAVDDIVLTAHSTLIKHLPLSGLGFLIRGAPILVFLGLAAGALVLARDNALFYAGAVVALFLGVLPLVSFSRHVKATLVDHFGAQGRARVLRCTVLRQMDPDGFLAIALFEVTPDDGRPPFVDQETVNLRRATLDKLAVGNVVAVRFDSACQHVYLQTPVTVLAHT